MRLALLLALSGFGCSVPPPAAPATPGALVHSVELFLVWGNTSNGIGPSDAERPLSRLIMDAWAGPRGSAIQAARRWRGRAT
jgi:hypothetical protein